MKTRMSTGERSNNIVWLHSFRTVNVRPFTFVTVTRSPARNRSLAMALQLSPCTRTRPGAPGTIGSSTCPVSPISPSAPVTGTARCDASASRTRKAAIAVKPSTDRQDEAEAQLELGRRRVDQHQRSEDQTDDAGDREQPVTRHLYLEREQHAGRTASAAGPRS